MVPSPTPLRLTWQASPKNKINFFADVQNNCTCRHVDGGFAAPEALSGWRFWPQGCIRRPGARRVTSKLLLEAGGVGARSRTGRNFRQPGVGPDDISILELSTGFRYNAATVLGGSTTADRKISDRFAQRFAVSYVTGSHAFKAGIQSSRASANTITSVNGDVDLQLPATASRSTLDAVRDAVPDQRANQGGPRHLRAGSVDAQAADAQRRACGSTTSTATCRRSTLAAGPVRAGARLRAGRRRAAAGRTSIRGSAAAYDLFGNGRTALKVSLGRYVGVTGIDIANANNPMITSVNSVNRTWNDTNGNFVPDCDLRNPGRQRRVRRDLTTQNFGKSTHHDPLCRRCARASARVTTYWDMSTEVQHQLDAPACR